MKCPPFKKGFLYFKDGNDFSILYCPGGAPYFGLHWQMLGISHFSVT